MADLPPHIQAQITQRLTEPQKKNRHNAVKTEQGGIKFDSKKEAERFNELMLLLQVGLIEDLRLQETFVLQRAYTTTEGKRIRAISYKADFSYTKEGKRIVEDVKGYKGGNAYQTFKTKAKMMQSIYAIEVVEV